MEINEMSHEYVQDCIGRLFILINETVVPYTLERNFRSEFEGFEDLEAFECMIDELCTVQRVIDLHDALVEKPVLVLGDYDLESLFTGFLGHVKKLGVDSLKDVDEESLVKDYVKSFMRGEFDE